MFSTVAKPKLAVTPYTIPSIGSLKLGESYAFALTAANFMNSSTMAVGTNAFSNGFGAWKKSSRRVAGIIPKAPRRNVIAIRREGSRLYLSRTRMYLSRNAAGAMASKSSTIRLAIFFSLRLESVFVSELSQIVRRICVCKNIFSIRLNQPHFVSMIHN